MLNMKLHKSQTQNLIIEERTPFFTICSRLAITADKFSQLGVDDLNYALELVQEFYKQYPNRPRLYQLPPDWTVS